ncbi:MAG: hypothetical protein JXB38_17890 [Anaerolineales bacterium]|nr:hypothetical protein [Anaerolineales bacterium]
MNFEILIFPALSMLIVSSLTLFISRDWRWNIAALGLQYLGVFMMVSNSWPPDLAVVKLVAGWMAASILGVSRVNVFDTEQLEMAWPSGRLFRVMTTLLALLTVLSFSPSIERFAPALNLPQVWGGTFLIVMGLLNLGFTTRPLRSVLGMLTILSGFEIMYAAVESAILVAGLLATVTLGIAMVGAYLLTAADLEVEETA